MDNPENGPASISEEAGTPAAFDSAQEQRKPTTYAGLHEARIRASSGSGKRRGRPNSAQPASFFVEGRPAPLHPKPQQMNYQQWQMWEYQQQMMLMQQQQWQAGPCPPFGHYATHDGSSPRHAAGDPNAPLVAQLIQQGDHEQLLAAYVAQRQAAAAESPTASGSGGYQHYVYPPSPGVWRSPSTAAEGGFLDWNGCLTRQGSSALGPPSRWVSVAWWVVCCYPPCRGC